VAGEEEFQDIYSFEVEVADFVCQKIVPEEEVQDVYSLEMEAANFVYQKWWRRRSWNSNTRRGTSRPCSDINKWSWFCPSSPS
jgi:hypothetical protein